MSWDWRQVAPALAVGLVLGGIGGAWGHRAARRWWRPAPESRLLEKFNRKLDLDPAQQAAVKAILDARRARVDAARQELHGRLRDIRLETRTEIAKVLTPEQRLRFEAMQERWDRRHKRDSR